jgi:hypothetical protein
MTTKKAKKPRSTSPLPEEADGAEEPPAYEDPEGGEEEEEDDGESDPEDVPEGLTVADVFRQNQELLKRLVKAEKVAERATRALEEREAVRTQFVPRAPDNPFAKPDKRLAAPRQPQIFRPRDDAVFAELQGKAKDALSPKAQDWVTIESVNSYLHDFGHYLVNTVRPIVLGDRSPARSERKEIAELVFQTLAHITLCLRTRREYIEESVFPTGGEKNFGHAVGTELYTALLRGTPLPDGVLAEKRLEYLAQYKNALISAAAKNSARNVGRAASAEPREGARKKTRRGGNAAKKAADDRAQAAARRGRSKEPKGGRKKEKPGRKVELASDADASD